MSPEMQQAFENDNKAMNISENGGFVAADVEEPQPEDIPETPPAPVQTQAQPQEMSIDDI